MHILTPLMNKTYQKVGVIKANNFFRNKGIKAGPAIILDRLQTPENIGSILRLAANFGCSRVILTEQLEINQTKIEKIARNSMQYLSVEIMPIEMIAYQFENIFAIETTSNSDNIYNVSFEKEIALVVGNEKYGISDQLLNICQKQVFIPMPGAVKSLNVSHALGIALFEWHRQMAIKEQY
jgi:tRNA G18 (ribose-2'-O)-methylase SpoU